MPFDLNLNKTKIDHGNLQNLFVNVAVIHYDVAERNRKITELGFNSKFSDC